MLLGHDDDDVMVDGGDDDNGHADAYSYKYLLMQTFPTEALELSVKLLPPS